MTAGEPQSQAHQRFSQFADRYVNSAVHAATEELDLLLAVSQPRPDWRAMDIATGGGHTALAFAPHVGQMVVTDFSQQMLNAARRHLEANGAQNAVYVVNDAERLPFDANTFDLITCRVAVHHFMDAFRFMQDCFRVLKPGGRLLIQDHVQPETPRDAEYLEAFERLRDPSHAKAFSLSEWRALYLDAGFEIDHDRIIKKEANFLEWAARQDCPPDVVEHLTVLLAQAPQVARDWLEPACIGTPAATFKHVYVVIQGVKAG
jgi:ubiquinone/menaquinone biosynthesis C-methylase UbiE